MLVTLQITTLGADLGPNFNLTANVGSVSPSTATKVQLQNGIVVTVNDSATQITITSTGTCTNSTVVNIGGTTTTSTTLAPATFILGYAAANFMGACGNYTTSPNTYYAANGQTLQIGTILYYNQNLSGVVSSGYYSNGTNWWRYSGGQIVETGSCTTTTTTTSTSTTTSTTSTTSTSSTSTSTSTTTTQSP